MCESSQSNSKMIDFEPCHWLRSVWQGKKQWLLGPGSAIYGIQNTFTFNTRQQSLDHSWSGATRWPLQWPCIGIFTRRIALNRLMEKKTGRPAVCYSGKDSLRNAGVLGERFSTCWASASRSSAGCPGTGWGNGSWETPLRDSPWASCTSPKVSY